MELTLAYLLVLVGSFVGAAKVPRLRALFLTLGVALLLIPAVLVAWLIYLVQSGALDDIHFG